MFELKYDGYRVVAGLDKGEARLVYRRGNDATAVFPEITRALRSLPFAALVLDGEAVVLDESSRSSFQRLQKRALLQRKPDIERASLLLPATYYAFDLLGFEDFDLRGLPLVERKRLLQLVLPKAGPIRYLDHVEEQGEAFYREVEKLHLEGIVAKKADSTYRGRRTADWLKIRVDRTDDFAIVGFTAPDGGRTGFGALHLAQYVDGRLEYAGRAGSGFDDAQLGDLRATLERDRRKDPPCTGHAAQWRGPHLGRAAARGRGSLQGADRRRVVASAGFPAAARRQGDRGLRPFAGRLRDLIGYHR